MTSWRNNTDHVANGNFAQEFADNQGVLTYAQTGNASFSTNPNYHYKIKDKGTTGNVYLFHYDLFNFKKSYFWGKLFKPNKWLENDIWLNKN